jgi:hypothetical protein
MTELTPEELSAKEALTQASNHLAAAQIELWQRTQNIDVSNVAMVVQLLVPQVDALAELLVQKALMTRIEYWSLCKDSILSAEGNLRKQLREMPSIVLAPPPRGKGNGQPS